MSEALHAQMMVKISRQSDAPVREASSAVRQRFQWCADQASVVLNLKQVEWPRPRLMKPKHFLSSSADAPGYADASFEYLRNQAPDVIICLVPDILGVDPTMAHLMHVHRNSLQHVFVVVTDSASLQDTKAVSVLDLPLASVREGSLYVPQFGENSVIDIRRSTAMGVGYLSVHCADDIPSDNVTGLLELAQLRKQKAL